MAEPLGQAATQAPHPMHSAASMAASADSLGMRTVLPSGTPHGCRLSEASESWSGPPGLPCRQPCRQPERMELFLAVLVLAEAALVLRFFPAARHRLLVAGAFVDGPYREPRAHH